MSGNSLRTSATNAKSFPGLIFSLIRWYPERTSFSTFLVNDCGVSQMPIETPQVISSRLPPSNVDKGNPLCWDSTSQRAFSTPALAISCPRTPAHRAGTSTALASSLPITCGARKSLITCHAVSVVSELKNGLSIAVTSPQPLIRSEEHTSELQSPCNLV